MFWAKDQRSLGAECDSELLMLRQDPSLLLNADAM